jgi:integrase
VSPYKKPGRPSYYVWPTLPGFGRIGPFSTGTANKALAARMEAYLQEVALSEPRLIDGLLRPAKAGGYSLPQLWAAKLQGRTDELQRFATDPDLRDCIERYLPLVKDRRYRDGFETLRKRLPAGARLSWLSRLPDPRHPGGETGAKNIMALYAAQLREGERPNSVARSLHQAVNHLLLHELGEAGRDAVMAGVSRPHEDDSRDVNITREEVARLLEACDDRLYPVVVYAMVTGFDRGPIARQLVRHFDPRDNSIEPQDTKTKVRNVRAVLPDVAAAIVRTLVEGKGPDDTIFGLGYTNIGMLWAEARARASGVPAEVSRGAMRDAPVSLANLRFKDLRHIAGTEAGRSMNHRELMMFLRHSSPQTSTRYLGSRPANQREQVNEAVRGLGLDRAHLRVRKGGAEG